MPKVASSTSQGERDTSLGEWITGRSAGTLAEVTVFRIMKAAARGEIRTLNLAGESTRYHREDVLKFKASK